MPAAAVSLGLRLRYYGRMRTLRVTLASVIALAALALMTASAFAADAGVNADIESKVRAAFADHPEMIAVANCESGFRQFAPSGSVLRGGPSGQYVGIFQIDEGLHSARAKGLGHDILTIDGNIGYARWLFDANGGSPWKGCLPKTVPAPVETGTLTLDLKIGAMNAQVAMAQRILNAAGFTVATGGPGSAGHETEYFGGLTREAVRKFQCAKKIACEGDEATTGYGRIGPRTRAALNAMTP
jgi:putative peptidoglycan binding protein